MKQILAVMLTITLLGGLLSGCGTSGGQSSSKVPDVPGQTQEQTQGADPAPAPAASTPVPSGDVSAQPAAPDQFQAEKQPQMDAQPAVTGTELLTGDLASMAAPINAVLRSMVEDGYVYDPYLPLFFWDSLSILLSQDGLQHSLVQVEGKEWKMPRQVVQEFATSLFFDYGDLFPLPDTMLNLRFDDAWDAYFILPRIATPAQCRIEQVEPAGDNTYQVTASLLSREGRLLARFQLLLVPNAYADGISQPVFRYAISSVACLTQEDHRTYAASGTLSGQAGEESAEFCLDGESYLNFDYGSADVRSTLERFKAGEKVSFTYTVDFENGLYTITSVE